MQGWIKPVWPGGPRRLVIWSQHEGYSFTSYFSLTLKHFWLNAQFVDTVNG